MMLSNNLLYLLLLYAVLDKENRLSTTAGLLAALAIMLYGTCRTAINACCNPCQGHHHCNNGNYNYANYNNGYSTANYNNANYARNNCNNACNNFWALNNLF